MTLLYVCAAISILAAGILFGTDAWWTRAQLNTWRAGFIRVAAFFAMVVPAIAADELFGKDDSRAAYGVAALVLWLPQLVLSMFWNYRLPDDDKHRGTADPLIPRR